MAGSQRTPLRVALVAALTSLLMLAPAGLARAGALPGSARLHLTVTLRPRDPAALAAYAQAVSTPGSTAYLRYLAPGQFARRFGPTRMQVAAVRRALRARGLTPGPTAAGGLSIPVHATVGQVEHGLSVSLNTRSLPGRRTAIAASAAPSLGPGATGVVQSVLGLNTTSAPRPLLARAPLHARVGAVRASPHVVTGGPQPCSDAQSVAASDNANTADQIASAYGFPGLYGTGNAGAGVTVAIYELESNDPNDIAAYQSCFGTHASVGYVPVDGGAGSGAGSGEAALDIETLIGLAPAANVLVYQGPNAQSSGPGSGPYDTFAAIINQDRARVVSISWGECEDNLGSGNAAAEATLFQQAAVQGQTIVAASGDNGSEDCNDGSATSPTQLAVDDPSSQPFVTGVGGTTLNALGPRPVESVWNSGGTVTGGLLQPGAGGGGISSLWPMGRDQQQAAPSLNVLGAGRTGAQCQNPGGYCRQVPDVAANADPSTGYVIYWSGGALGQPAGWQSIGGTSAAAPVWAALMTLADASPPCAGNPLGFAGPALYRAAGGDYAGNFNDVRIGNNDFLNNNGGRFAAGPGYDEASGLGSPNATPLAAALCADTLRLVSPGTVRLTVHSIVALHLQANDPRGIAINYSASGLPAGLSLDPATGQITGRPRQSGSSAVHVAAQDAQGSASSTSFTATVGRVPRVSRASISSLAARRPRLSFTLTAGRGSPAFTKLTVTPPSGFKFGSTRGVVLKARGVHRPRFRARLVHRALQITLRRSLSQLTLTVSRPTLRAVSPARARVRRRSASKLSLSIVDSSSGTSRVQSRIAQGR